MQAYATIKQDWVTQFLPPPSPNHQKNMADFRPVARIFARGGYVSVGYYVCMYNHARQGGSGGMLHQEIF